MAGKLFIRAIRSRFQAAVIWAMVPVAMISGRTISGCVSPSGHFELNCHCSASMGDSAAPSGPCHCHCPCCQGKDCCCCKSKSSCCCSMASNARRTNGNGFQSSHCQQVSAFATTPVVNVSTQIQDLDQSADLTLISSDVPSALARTTLEQIAELNTGPPPNNLVVALHRFLI